MISQAVLEKQNWMLAGASAGFLDRPTELAGKTAANVVFTGSIRSVLHLLNTADMLVRMPARMALMTGDVSETQMIKVEGPLGPRRDIALWSRNENRERPDFIKVYDLLRAYMAGIDKSVPTFGLDL